MKSLPFLLTFDYSQQNGRLKVQVMSSVFAIINTFDCERRSSTVPVGFCRDIFANGESIMEVSSGQVNLLERNSLVHVLHNLIV